MQDALCTCLENNPFTFLTAHAGILGQWTVQQVQLDVPTRG